MWRTTLAGCRVLIPQRLDGTIVICYGPHELGRYTQHGRPIVELQRASKSKRSKKPAFSNDSEVPTLALRHVSYAIDRRV
jgi:hypothetical protein